MSYLSGGIVASLLMQAPIVIGLITDNLRVMMGYIGIVWAVALVEVGRIFVDISTFHKLSYGVYVIGAKMEDKLNGLIANTVFQITAEPPFIAVSIHKDNLTHQYISQGGVFTVSILNEDAPMTFIGIFGFRTGRDMDKWGKVQHKLGVTGAPISLEYTVGYMEAKVVQQIDVGTHTIFVGEVVAAESVALGECMTYAYYHQVKKGKSPKNAPTYIGKDQRLSADSAGSGK